MSFVKLSFIYKIHLKVHNVIELV